MYCPISGDYDSPQINPTEFIRELKNARKPATRYNNLERFGKIVCMRCGTKKKHVSSKRVSESGDMKILLVLLALLWFGQGCRTRAHSDHVDSMHNTQEETEIRLWAASSHFGQSLSRTVLKFGLDDCHSALLDVNRAIDKLTVGTQPDYWDFVKQRYSTSKARYSQLWEDWSETIHSGTPQQASVQQRLAKLDSLVRETDRRVERRGSEYTQQRRQYELRKRQRFAELQSEREEKGLTDQHYYADENITIGLTIVDVTLRHVLVTLEAYANEPATSVSDAIRPPPKAGLSSAKGLEDYVNLIDQQDRSLGPPQEVHYDRLYSLDGLVVTMAFVRDPVSERTPIQLRIARSALGNAGPITLTVPADHEPERVARALEGNLLRQAAQADGPASTDSEVQVILCRREGMHLMVPVQVNIHGVEVKTAMLLDTGASVTVLSKSAYNRGLARPLAELESMRLTTTNGPVTCPVDTLRVSTSAYARSVPVALTNGSRSLLGANYFAGRRFTIDLDRACIYVHP